MSQLGSRSGTDVDRDGGIDLFRRRLMPGILAAPVVLSSRAIAATSISVWTEPPCSG